jgi:uncharacterized membrane protein YccC
MIAQTPQPDLRNSTALDTSDEAELNRLRQREEQIKELIGCPNSEELIHDLRNVLNELQLLRLLYQSERAS